MFGKASQGGQALLPGCVPSREPAKPFRRGPAGVLSRSTSAPWCSRTALQHWRLCHFHLAFHYLSPQMSAAVTAPAGGLSHDGSILPTAPISEELLQAHVRHHHAKARQTSRGVNQQANKTTFHLHLWSIHTWPVTWLWR